MNQTTLKNKINEIKNMLEGIKSTLDEERMSELEITQGEQKKRIFLNKYERPLGQHQTSYHFKYKDTHLLKLEDVKRSKWKWKESQGGQPYYQTKYILK